MSGKLTEEQLDSLAVPLRPSKHGDAKGLYLLVMPNGSKYWRMKYRFLKKEKNLALGVWPEVSLQEARFECLKARQYLRQGIDPSYVKRHLKVVTSSETLNPTTLVPVLFDASDSTHQHKETP